MQKKSQTKSQKQNKSKRAEELKTKEHRIVDVSDVELEHVQGGALAFCHTPWD